MPLGEEEKLVCFLRRLCARSQGVKVECKIKMFPFLSFNVVFVYLLRECARSQGERWAQNKNNSFYWASMWYLLVSWASVHDAKERESWVQKKIAYFIKLQYGLNFLSIFFGSLSGFSVFCWSAVFWTGTLWSVATFRGASYLRTAQLGD